MSGPLDGVRIIEMAGLGPAPFSAMLFADMGADVIRIDRPGAGSPLEPWTFRRGRRSVALDLKSDDGRQAVLDLVATADALIEGFRPGVMERLGIGPDDCHDRNPDLVYGRMTGWGQDGPWASMAGHDIDYIALTGMLHAIGPAERPIPPLNLVGDFGGGGMFLVAGVLAGVLAARSGSGGCVVDAAMTDGAAYLGTMPYGFMGVDRWLPARERNLLDGGAPFYRTYETSDGGHMAVGALEPQFYAALLDGLGLAGEDLPQQMSIAEWPILRDRFAEVFASKSRDEWTAIFEGTDACVAPVLSMAEAPHHPHNVERGTFMDIDGAPHPAPAPRFSTGTEPASARAEIGEHTAEVLAELGWDDERIGRVAP